MKKLGRIRGQINTRGSKKEGGKREREEMEEKKKATKEGQENTATTERGKHSPAYFCTALANKERHVSKREAI